MPGMGKNYLHRFNGALKIVVTYNLDPDKWYADELFMIQIKLNNGAIVTVPRTLTPYLVTEYGKANLFGLSIWKRAEQLIKLAHPDFREYLISEAEKMKIWKPGSRL